MLGYIIIFCVLLFFSFLTVLKKRRDNVLLIVLRLLYLGSAIVSVFHYCSTPESYKELNIFSYFFLFISLIVASSPLYGYQPFRYENVQKMHISTANALAVILILLYLPDLILTIPEIIYDINEILFDFAYASEMYNDTAEMTATQTGQGINNIASVFRNSFSEVIVFFPFYYVLYEKRNKLITILLWLSMFSPLFTSFRLGSRTMMSWWILEIIICFLLFRNYYIKATSKWINRIVYAISSFVIVVFVLLTIGRFATGMYENDSHVENSLVSYAGQGTLNFSDDILQNDVYQYGDNCFPLFRRMIGLEASDNLYERQAKWSSSMKIRQGAFYTFIGDFYNDFSPFFGFVLLLFLSLILNSIIRRKDGKIISASKLYLIYFCSCVFFNGLFYFSYKGIGGNLRIIVNLLFILLLSTLLSNKKYNYV